MTKGLLDRFVELGKTHDFVLNLPEIRSVEYQPLTNDGLFHLPLISLGLLAVAKSTKAGLVTSESGRLIGLLFEETIPGFRGSSQQLGWSSTLRRRTAEALVFLETLKFIEIETDRRVSISDIGRKFLLQIKKEETELGQALRGFERHIPDVRKREESLL